MNKPYVKQYEDGKLLNPIEGSYPSPFENRASRRQKPKRAFSNKRGIQLIVSRVGDYAFYKHRRQLQHVDGKAILHYVS